MHIIESQTMILSRPHFPFILFAFLFFSFYPVILSAQQFQIDIDEQSQNQIMLAPVQVCDFYPNLNWNNLTIINNERQIPAYSLYQNLWDTLYLRSEKIEIPFFDNQLKIILIQDVNTPFAFPVSGVVATNYIKNKGKQHTGVDFAVQKNEPVVVCFDGVVRIAKKFEKYGNTVVVRHYNGLETVYAMLDQVCVVTGQQVKAGELVGYIGNLNQNKRTALHFEIRFLNEFFNPDKVINFLERKLQDNILTLTPNDFISVPVAMVIQDAKQQDTKSDKNSSQQQLLDTPKNMPLFHTVDKGETINRICLKYNITEQQLRSLNNIKGDHIEIGQKLRVQ